MPELPEVESVRRGLADAITGRRIEAVRVLHPRPIRNHLLGEADFVHQLTGATFATPGRRGKFLWLPLVGGRALMAHLGMSGQFRVDRPEAELVRNTRVIFDLDDGQQLRFVDQRMFGGLSISALTEGVDIVPADAAHIAPDPFDRLFDRAQVVARMRASRSSIKALLLNQRVVSGFGNIYADETLWRAKVHHQVPGERLSAACVGEVLDHGSAVMAEALAAGGTSFDALYVHVNGESGYFSRFLHCYSRAGEPCERCGTLIVREPFMNRSSYFCPRCQRRPRR